MMRTVLGLAAGILLMLVLGGCGEGQGGAEGEKTGRRPVPESPQAPPGAQFSGGASATDDDAAGGPPGGGPPGGRGGEGGG